jgi:hypothetical protein
MIGLKLVLRMAAIERETMDKIGVKINLLICLAILLGIFAVPAMAEPKPWVLGWWPGHWEWAEYKNFNPYLERGKHTQNQQWSREDWYVQDWVSQHENEFKLIDGFFRTDILRKQTEDDDVPVLVVGPHFYRLGGFDKRRVLTTLDAVYGITDRGTNPVIVLKDWHTKREIGLFNKDGLQLE